MFADGEIKFFKRARIVSYNKFSLAIEVYKFRLDTVEMLTGIGITIIISLNMFDNRYIHQRNFHTYPDILCPVYSFLN